MKAISRCNWWAVLPFGAMFFALSLPGATLDVDLSDEISGSGGTLR
jgi:hypothetical protein